MYKYGGSNSLDQNTFFTPGSHVKFSNLIENQATVPEMDGRPVTKCD